MSKPTSQSTSKTSVIGRGKPPKDTQFKRGKSGNPGGRPKGSKNLATLIAEAAYDQIMVTTKNGESKRLSRIQATTLQLANNAAKGDQKAILAFMDWVDKIEQRVAARPTEMSIAEADLAVLYAVHDRMERCSTPQESGNAAAPR